MEVFDGSGITKEDVDTMLEPGIEVKVMVDKDKLENDFYQARPQQIKIK